VRRKPKYKVGSVAQNKAPSHKCVEMSASDGGQRNPESRACPQRRSSKTAISAWPHVLVPATKSSNGVLDPQLHKQEPPIKCDRRLFSWAFRCESLVSRSSISLCHLGHEFVSVFQPMTCGVSLSTILASCTSLVRVRLGEGRHHVIFIDRRPDICSRNREVGYPQGWGENEKRRGR
jgi:hypothetical protein